MYKLKSSVDAKKVHKSKLSKNPLAVDHFEKYPKQINWNGMSENPSPKAIALLEQNLDKVNWKGVCKNPSLEAMHFLAKHPANIDWDIIYDNPYLIPLLEMLEQISGQKLSTQIYKFDWCKIWKHPDVFRLVGTELMNRFKKGTKVVFKKSKQSKKSKQFIVRRPYEINWKGLSENPSPTALNMLAKNMDKIDFGGLFRNTNPASLEILMKFLEIGINRIKYDHTNQKIFAKACKHPEVVRILSTSVDKLQWGHWKLISANPHAIPLLEENPRKINWSEIYKNPNAGPLIEKYYEICPNKVSDFEAAYHDLPLSSLNDSFEILSILRKIEKGGYDWDMWKMLAQNPNSEMVSRIMEKNPEKIKWAYLSVHPAIFDFSYSWLKTRCDVIREELMKVAMHPSKIQRLLDMGYEIEDLEDLM
jgi:hypothetical protein